VSLSVLFSDWYRSFATKTTFDEALALLISLEGEGDKSKTDRRPAINQLLEKYIMNFCLTDKRNGTRCINRFSLLFIYLFFFFLIFIS
jgi:hypothetical protein